MAHSTKEQLINLRQACLELAKGFERAADSVDDEELVITLHEASYALIEVRRATETLTQSLQSKNIQSIKQKLADCVESPDDSIVSVTLGELRALASVAPCEIARVTAHEPCIMMGCTREYGHDGDHEYLTA